VELNPIRLHVNLVFPEQENARFDLDLELRGVRYKEALLKVG